MRFEPLEGSCPYGVPGIFQGLMRFAHPVLDGHAWPICEIRGRVPGPRLCVSAGVHVNEVSSIAAAVRLQRLFDWETMHGTVAILPIVNLPAQFEYTEYLCPVDGKNINFSFPGDPQGTFTEALCDGIQHHWCADAACYIDLHGGDLRENVAKFSMYQRTGDVQHDASCERLARCFDADIVVGLEPQLLLAPGRPPTAFAREGRLAIMSEAGANGIPDETSIAFHVGGVLNVARALGIVHEPQKAFTRRRVACDQYLWVPSPSDGFFVPAIEPADTVRTGQYLGELRDLFGRPITSVIAPASGLLLWRLTHPLLKQGTPVLAIAVPEGWVG